MPTNSIGIPTYANQSAQVRNDIHVFTTNWFVNRTPLAARLPRLPVGSTNFKIVTRKFQRPRSTTLAAAITGTSDTSITVADGTTFMVGDVLEIGSERLAVTADPTSSTLTVARGLEGTSAATASNGATVTLIGNARTGAEVDQSATSYIPVAVDQYTQTYQHPVQVAGTTQGTSSMELPSGARSPFDQNKMEALGNMMDDIEVSSYYGKGDSGSSTGRPKQKGLKTLLTTNNTTSPTNSVAYKPDDFVRDTVQKCRTAGGDPDVILFSPDWMTAFSVWSKDLTRLDAGANIFGTSINVFTAPFLGRIAMIEAPLLSAGTAITLTSSQIRMRAKRNEFWQPRGSRGDAIEGDWISEMAIELENEHMSAWLSGVTGWSSS